MEDRQPRMQELEIMHKTPLKLAYDGKEDFALWQQKLRDKLCELSGMDKFTRCEDDFKIDYTKEEADFTEIRFTFQSEEGFRVPCVLLIPKGVEKAPVSICLQGHGTGMHISLGRAKYDIDEPKLENGDRDFALQCVERGICALALEQRNFGEQGGNPRPTCYEAAMTALLVGRTVIAARVWDIQRAMDVVQKYFSDRCDTTKFYCMGNSGGGTATFYAAALDERIVAAMPSCAFCTFEESIGNKHHCACNYIPHAREWFDMAELAALTAPRPMVIVTGQTDGIFPVEPAKAEFQRVKNYYKAAGAEDKCAHVIGAEGHRFYAADAWPVFEQLTKGDR